MQMSVAWPLPGLRAAALGPGAGRVGGGAGGEGARREGEGGPSPHQRAAGHERAPSGPGAGSALFSFHFSKMGS